MVVVTPVKVEESYDDVHRVSWPAPLVLVLIFTVACVVDRLAYERTELNPPAGLGSLPSWTDVAAIVGVGVVGLVVLAWSPARLKSLAILFTVVMVVLTTSTAWLAIVSLQGIPVPPNLQTLPSPAVTAQAQQTLAAATTEGVCKVARSGHPGPVPMPYQRCATLYSGHAQVSYIENWAGQSWHGFIYSPGATQPGGPDTCERRLSSAWWASMTEGDPSRGCPFGYQFVEAP